MGKKSIKTTESLSQRAYAEIKAMIMKKELVPGQLVSEAQFQELLDIGRTPVREAILALARDDLVTIHPRKGIEVARPSLKRVHDIFEIRSLLEPSVLRKSFDTVDMRWAADMRAELAQHQNDDTSDPTQTAIPLIDLDNEFHLQLVDSLNNQYASQLMRGMVETLNLIRITVWRPQRYRVSNREHIAILDAIIERDVEGACTLLAEHLELSYQEAITTMMHADL